MPPTRCSSTLRPENRLQSTYANVFLHGSNNILSPGQLPELEEKIRSNSAKCAQVEHECAELERDIMQLKTKLTTSYRSRILATFPGGNLAQVLSYSQSMSLRAGMALFFWNP